MDYATEIQKLIEKGQSILVLAEHEKIKNVEGLNKFKRKVKKEILFLKSVLTKTPLEAYVKCSNLQHLEALIRLCITENDVVSLLKPFKYSVSDKEPPKKLIIDFVDEGGSRWNKVSARNARALTINSSDDCIFGIRSVMDQAKDYVECSKKNPHVFHVPKIAFHFASGIEVSLANDLKMLGILVKGNVIDDGNDLISISTDLYEKKKLNALNLDVTTMMAYVSSSTNGGSYAKIESPVLSAQLTREQKTHVKEFLNELFEDRKLLCCQTAYDSFTTILNVVGGKEEKKRGEEILKRITIVPDSPSARSLSLQPIGKITNRAVIIFGTGDHLKIPTVTANVGFVRAAEHRGINFVVFTHESRALTEAKELRLEPS